MYKSGQKGNAFDEVAKNFRLFPINGAIVRKQTDKLLSEARKNRPVVGSENKSGQHDKEMTQRTKIMLKISDAREKFEKFFHDRGELKNKKNEQKQELGKIMTEAAMAQRKRKSTFSRLLLV